MTEADECYTVQEAARILKISTKKLYGLLRDHAIQHIHIGRDHRIPREEIQYILKKGLRNLVDVNRR